MKCPHCGTETEAALPRCMACGKSLQITANDFFADRESKPRTRGEGSAWGPRLLGVLILLALAAYALNQALERTRRQTLSTADVGGMSVSAPVPKFSMPQAPKIASRAPLIQPVSVALPGMEPFRLAFGSRDRRVRQLFLERNGGDARSEDAVERGLKWLAENQNKDTGGWDAAGANGGRQEFNLGVAGLALLAFLGAGHTHMADGPYKETVAQAIQFILRQQNTLGQFPGRLYHQGICTMAIVEAYGMTGDTTLQLPAERAVAAIVASQTESGGWDYNFTSPNGRGDTSVTGWQVMALKSARRLGIDFPEEVLTRAREFLTGVYRDGFVGYSNVGNWWSSLGLTAAGVNAALYSAVEADADDVHGGLGLMLRHVPDEPKPHGDGWSPGADIYFWYHTNLALSRLGGPEWRFWNERLKPLLCKLQAKEGYWDTYGDRWREYGGRIYFSALCILALEVYYRYD